MDVYIAGFPCQPFSVAGNQQGFEDEKGRGIIFWSIHEYIDLKRPKVFILENVKGITELKTALIYRRFWIHCNQLALELQAQTPLVPVHIIFIVQSLTLEITAFHKIANDGTALGSARVACEKLKNFLLNFRSESHARI